MIVYIDMDGVLADYDKAKIGKTEEELDGAGFFLSLPVIQDAFESVKELSELADIYLLSTAPWTNIHSSSEKRIWAEKHFGDLVFKRVILSHNKGLLKGDYLIDDRTVNGVSDFEGEHIHFGSDKFPDWKTTMIYLRSKLRNNTND